MRNKKILKIITVIIIILSPIFPVNSYAVETPATDSIVSTNDISEKLYSNCLILMEARTGDILYEKNAYQKMYPASTTKTLTAIIVLENCDLNELVTVSASAVNAVPPDYTKAHLQARRTIYCRAITSCVAYSFSK